VGSTAGLDRCGKSRPSPGFDPLSVQPVASRYTDYTTCPIVPVKGEKNCGEGVEEGVGKRASTRQYKNVVITAGLV